LLLRWKYQQIENSTMDHFLEAHDYNRGGRYLGGCGKYQYYFNRCFPCPSVVYDNEMFPFTIQIESGKCPESCVLITLLGFTNISKCVSSVGNSDIDLMECFNINNHVICRKHKTTIWTYYTSVMSVIEADDDFKKIHILCDEAIDFVLENMDFLKGTWKCACGNNPKPPIKRVLRF